LKWVSSHPTGVAVSFDLFGTFVHVDDGPATLADGPEGWPC
jgi:hypothetical protein